MTLFHALPGAQEQAVRAVLREQAARPRFGIRVAGVRSLGRGVAYALESPELQQLRRALGRGFELTAQDRQPFRPHVTVQNKVAPEVARALLQELQRDCAAYEVTATGLVLWRYVGPTWDLLLRELFSAPQ